MQQWRLVRDTSRLIRWVKCHELIDKIDDLDRRSKAAVEGNAPSVDVGGLLYPLLESCEQLNCCATKTVHGLIVIAHDRY